MATIVFSAAGAALGGSVGGTVLGLSMTAVGRFVGATLGRALDQRLLGAGAEPVETGRVSRFRLTGAGEGDAIPRLHGRMRLGGQVIWASRFSEAVHVSGGGGGGKGTAPRPVTRSYSYSVSLAVALCEGPIGGVTRVWANGVEVSAADLNMRVYTGSRDQAPDPAIEAVEGAGAVPAYRGTAYVVMEDLPLAQFGDRVPQFSFEVLRHGAVRPGAVPGPGALVRAVAMMPGTGEYALATTPVSYDHGPGKRASANVHTPAGQTDFAASVAQLGAEAPGCEAVSLVLGWFGDDLRCGQCRVRPKVEHRDADGAEMPWRVAGVGRASADMVARDAENRPVYGGTPADASVIEALTHLRAQGKAVMVYPFILMEQMTGNGLPDPWSDAPDQSRLPWRGRITTAIAPGRDGSPDGTAEAAEQVAAFFGTAVAADFTVAGGAVAYSGPGEWRYRRFILHQAALCAAAGGVDAFCIGSEMRALTRVRGPGGSFPAVDALIALAAEVRALLGPDVRIGYAADWTEYGGYGPGDGSGDRYYPLDPLWADDTIDFVGIDNYMPLSDWREGLDHLDAQDWPSINDLDYLKSNIEGGEGHAWYYHSPEARAAQIRTPITDGAHDEPWIWRVKDIRNWWGRHHYPRVGGARQAVPTAWVPGSKPIWFTELGCAAVDKGTNQPNRFFDSKSSESGLPYHSDGRRDELIQMQYLRAMLSYWLEPGNNPVSDEYGGPMVDMRRAFVWAWDARPYPVFPARAELWSDAENYARGHWVTGRLSHRALDGVVDEICRDAGLLEGVDVSNLHGVVRGYGVDQVGDARAALQPLMLAHGFDAVERGGALRFTVRSGAVNWDLPAADLVQSDEMDAPLEHSRAAEAEIAGRVRLTFVEAGGDHEVAAEEAILPQDESHAVAATEVPMALTRAEARSITERWLAEAELARDGLRLSLPPSRLAVGAGDVLRLEGQAGHYRVDRVEQGAAQLIEAVRIDPSVYGAAPADDVPARTTAFAAPVPVLPLFMDLPLLRGDEVPHAPHLAAVAQPWPGRVAVYASASDADYVLNTVLERPASLGVTQSALAAARPGLLNRGADLMVRMQSGALDGVDMQALLAGRNLAAIGGGGEGDWEVIQFAEAELVAADTYILRGLLRGQAGSDGAMPAQWPAGAYLVLLDGASEQIDLPEAQRGLARHYRIGPARRGYDDPSYSHLSRAFAGVGLRPYRPAHLRARAESGGALALSWGRRTREGGDSWDAPDVPLAEESERYLLRITRDGALLREVDLASPNWTYDAAARAEDGTVAGSAPFRIEVAQLSARVGPGYFAGLDIGG
ncbi:MAG: host specificity protein [Sediminimonas qiaohouensis]|uniref:Host specificity protein n=1 Tax=Sediminimonas qiaohouensis TaxID=552061 RepID=A0A7C9HK86_9RHOB|nr:glycoside hydrolase TIM-barrel-like domain-containing protein [Sediminimonas qiaohouensis]MTJ03588.1 host specificity protein [Sediminimonas qiaohouensis]